jgi:hypothetical protein
MHLSSVAQLTGARKKRSSPTDQTERTEEAFHGRVIEAIALAGHALHVAAALL